MFHMKLDAGGDDVRTILGALCSFVLFLIVLLFAYLKADVLINKKDVDILSTLNDNFFTPDDVIDYKSGFNIAAAFTAYDSETEDILDPTYGEIVFMHYYWGVQEDGQYKAGRRRIDSQRKCSQEELGFGDNPKDSKFNPSNEGNKALVDLYQKKFHCLGEEDLYVFGDFNSDRASLMNVQLVLCNKETQPNLECKSEDDIKKFLRNKYVLLLYNQVRFDSNFYGQEAIRRESQIKWITINTQIQMSSPYTLSQTQLFLQDQAINLDDLTELDDNTIFKLEPLPAQSYEKDYNAQSDITIEVNPQQRVVARDGYTFLDLLSDVGGI